MYNNPLLNSQERNNSSQSLPNQMQIQQTKELMNKLKTLQNPQQALEQYVSQNPALLMILNQGKNSGLNLQQIAQQLARANGVDLNQLINTLQS